MVVGREVELELLLRSVANARAGQSSCILLLGEGGVGKTRLLGEVATAARQLGLGVLTGRAPITSPLAFSVVAEALRSWLRGHPHGPMGPFDRGLRLVLPEWPEAATASELSESQLRLLALEGVVQLVRAIAAAEGAAVILLDDLHGADPETLEVARYLATAAVEATVVVGALRSGESPLADEFVRSLRGDGIAELVQLRPLTQQAVTNLVAALLDTDPPPPLVADIVARTDGVPLLVEEVLDAHLSAGSVQMSNGEMIWRGGMASVPRTVREMVSARLDRLTPGGREVLAAGAVAGDFDPALMTAVTAAAADEVSAAVVAGINAGLLETTGGAVAFRHAVIREAVVETTVPHVINVLHSRIAAALADASETEPTVLERRARHLIAVGAHDDAAALLTAAALARLDEHALLGAERLARSALELARTSATGASAADALAQSLAAQGRWLAALEVDAATSSQHGETPARRHRMATSAIEGSQPELAGPIIARSLAAGDAAPSIHIAAGRAAMVSGDASRALQDARSVLEAPQANGDLDARLSALELQGRAFDFLGQRADAEAAWTRQADEAASAGRTQAQLRAVVQLGKVELFAGRPPVRLREAVELARVAGAFIELAWAEENLAIGLCLQGDPAASAALLDDAIIRCRNLRLDQLAYLIAARGGAESYLSDAAEDLLLEAETLCPTSEMRLHTASIRSDLALRQGRYDDAVALCELTESIRRAMPGIAPSDSPCWLVWALAANGRRDEAQRALDEARAIPDLARWHPRPVLVAAASALLADDEAGIDNAISAATGAMPFDIALMRVLGAKILQGPARVRWLREALDTYERAGAPIDADRVRGLLRAAGGPVPRRRRDGAPVVDELAKHAVTAREAEVLALLGQGLTNAEIAQRLYVSVRTVETHVSSLLGKLGVRTRGQLTAFSASLKQGG